MKSTFKTDDGRSITVQPLPHSKAVLIQSHDPQAGALVHLLIPADMAGVFAQAIELAAEWKPGLNPRAVSDAQQFGIGMDLTVNEAATVVA